MVQLAVTINIKISKAGLFGNLVSDSLNINRARHIHIPPMA